MTRDAKNAVRQEAIDRLREWIKPGDTLHTQMKHVSRSGMSRVIQVVKIQCPDKYRIDEGHTEPELLYLGYNVAQVTDMRYDRDKEGVKVGGCGMDMGFHLVYELSHALFPDGFECVGQGCPSNDHSNGDRNHEPHQHRDGGYAVRSRWL